MTVQIRLYSQDYTQVLMESDNFDAVKRHFARTGLPWLGLVVDRAGRGGATRWSGRIVAGIGAAQIVDAREYLTCKTEDTP